MYISRIDWLDEESKEATITVASDNISIVCFCYPCTYSVGDVVNSPLECLDTDDIVVYKAKDYYIQKADGALSYLVIGKLKDRKNGIIEVDGIIMHIDEGKIPNDIVDGMYVQFNVSRIDIW